MYFGVLEPTTFVRSSRFARLQYIQCALAGRNVYMRFSCSTGDAMGMNMVSKGVQNVFEYLQDVFPDMDVVSLSGSLILSPLFLFAFFVLYYHEDAIMKYATHIM